MLKTILSKCDKRHSQLEFEQCKECKYSEYCPKSCEKCLDFLHNPTHAPKDAPGRKYDCIHMADVYTCKYSCRYTSEIIYALEKCLDLHKVKKLKVLSFGCGPCTDLFAIDFLRKKGKLSYDKIKYRGVDYSEDVWINIHNDISEFNDENNKIKFYYQDICDFINIITEKSWTPNLIVFQYVFSDMRKHSNKETINNFIKTFSEYFNKKIDQKSYIIINDVNLGINYGGGREYFNKLLNKIKDSKCIYGHFHNDNGKGYYPTGYPYGFEFPENNNYFDLSPWKCYSPFNTCASAQMIIKKVEKK